MAALARPFYIYCAFIQCYMLAEPWPTLHSHLFDYEVRHEVGYAGTYYYRSHVSFLAITVEGLGPIKYS